MNIIAYTVQTGFKIHGAGEQLSEDQCLLHKDLISNLSTHVQSRAQMCGGRRVLGLAGCQPIFMFSERTNNKGMR